MAPGRILFPLTNSNDGFTGGILIDANRNGANGVAALTLGYDTAINSSATASGASSKVAIINYNTANAAGGHTLYAVNNGAAIRVNTAVTGFGQDSFNIGAQTVLAGNMVQLGQLKRSLRQLHRGQWGGDCRDGGRGAAVFATTSAFNSTLLYGATGNITETLPVGGSGWAGLSNDLSNATFSGTINSAGNYSLQAVGTTSLYLGTVSASSNGVTATVARGTVVLTAPPATTPMSTSWSAGASLTLNAASALGASVPATATVNGTLNVNAANAVTGTIGVASGGVVAYNTLTPGSGTVNILSGGTLRPKLAGPYTGSFVFSSGAKVDFATGNGHVNALTGANNAILTA